MKTNHQIWMIEAGPTGDLHNPEGPFQVSSERLAEELSQLSWALTDALARLQEHGSEYQLNEVTFEVAFDGRVGLALVGRTGASRVATLKFVRCAPRAVAAAST